MTITKLTLADEITVFMTKKLAGGGCLVFLPDSASAD